MANKIGVVIAADGEAKFSQAMKNCATSAKNLQKDMRTLKNDFKDSANSMEYLTQRQNMLKAAQDNYKRALDSAKSGLSHQKSVYKDQQKALEELRKKLDDAKKAVSAFEKSGDTQSRGCQDAKKAVDDYSKAIDKQSIEIQKSEGKLSNWEHAVNKAQHDLNSTNKAIDENARYLNEAAQSADGCATSIDRFGNEIKDAGQEADTSKGKIGGMMDKIKTGALEKVGHLATQAVAKLGQKALDAAKYVVDVGSTFEASMSKVEALSGASGSELDALKDKASELGRTTQFSASEAADAMANMALAGWDTQEMLTGIDGVLQLAAAGGMDLASASDAVAGYLAAFNMEAGEAGKLADVMATAQAKSKTTTDQLAEAYGTCATNMTQAGQEMTTTTALLEAMASVNDTGSAAGTKLSAVMAQITQKMKDGKIQIGDTEVAVTDSTGAFRDMVDIITDVEKATDGMTNAERASALQKTFNRQSVAGMNELLSVGSDRLREYKGDLENSEGAASRMAGVMNDNLQGAVKEMNSATEGLGNALYDKVSGPLTGAVEIATGLINGITDAISPVQTELDSFLADVEATNKEVNGMVTAAEQDVAQAESKVTMLQTYKETILELQGVLNSGGTLDTFQLYQMKNAVTAVKDEVPFIADNFDEVTGKISISTETIKTLFDEAAQGIEETAKALALQDVTVAYEKAMTNQAAATAAVTVAQKELNDYIAEYENGDFDKKAQFDINKKRELEGALNKATDAQRAATEEAEHAKDVQDELTKELAEEEEQRKKNAAAIDENTRREKAELARMQVHGQTMKENAASTEEATEANEDFAASEEEVARAAEEADQKVEAAHKNAAESIKQAYDDAKNSIESSFKIDPFSEVAEDNSPTVETMTKNLKAQLDAWKTYQENLAIIKDHVGEEIAPEFMQYLISMGEEGAGTVQHIVDTLNGKVEDATKTGSEVVKELSDSYVQGLDMREDISRELAQDAVVLQAGLNKMGSSDVEWGNLQASMESAIQGLGSDAQSQLQSSFQSAMDTARACGVAIPEGLLDGIESSDDPEASVKNAIDQIEAAVQGHAAGLMEIAKESGLKIPEGLSESIEAGGPELEAAYQTLLQMLSELDTSTFEESGKQAVESQTAGMESASDSVTGAAEGVMSEAASAAEGSADSFTAAGETAGTNIATGITNRSGDVSSAVESVVSNAATAAEGQTYAFYAVGVHSAEGIARGMQNRIQEVAKQAAQLVTNAINAARSAGGISSPSKKSRDIIGKNIGLGTALGIKMSTKETEKAAEYQLGRTLAKASAWLEKKRPKIEGLGKSFAVSASSVWEQLGAFEMSHDFGVGKTVTKTTGSGKNKTTKKVKKDAETYYGEIISAAEGYMERVQTLYDVSDEQELDYWQKVISRLKRGTSAWYEAKKTINRLTEEIEEAKYDAIVSDAEDYVTEQKRANAMSVSNEIAYWNTILSQLKRGSDQYKQVADKIAELKTHIGTMNSANNILDVYETYYEASEKALVDYWDKVRRQFTTGTKDRIDADKKYYDAAKAYNEKLKSIEDSYVEKIENANQAYKDAIDERKRTIMDAYDIFDAFESNSATGKELLFNIEAQAAGYEEWSESIKELEKRGIFSRELMDALTEKGPTEIAAIKALLMLTDQELQKFQRAYDRKEAAAAEQARKDSEKAKKERDDAINKANKEKAEEMARINKVLDPKLESLVSSLRTIADDETAKIVSALTGKPVAAAASTPATTTPAATPATAPSAPSQNSDAQIAAANAAKAAQDQSKSVKDSIKAIIKEGSSHKKSVSAAEKKSHSDLWEYVVKNYGRAIHDKQIKEMAALLGVKVSDTPTKTQKDKVLKALKKKGLASGSRGVSADGLQWIDELGSEMIIRRSDNAILTRLRAHDAVIPANLTDNLWKWGALDPSRVMSGAEMNAHLCNTFSAQIKAAEKAHMDVADALAVIISYMPQIASGLRVDGKRVAESISGDMSQALAAQYRRRR